MLFEPTGIDVIVRRVLFLMEIISIYSMRGRNASRKYRLIPFLVTKWKWIQLE
jgi:hypothetical protein